MADKSRIALMFETASTGIALLAETPGDVPVCWSLLIRPLRLTFVLKCLPGVAQVCWKSRAEDGGVERQRCASYVIGSLTTDQFTATIPAAAGSGGLIQPHSLSSTLPGLLTLKPAEYTDQWLDCQRHPLVQ